jgi:hypothetical protein
VAENAAHKAAKAEAAALVADRDAKLEALNQ